MKYIVSLNGRDYEIEVEQGEARVLSESESVATAGKQSAALDLIAEEHKSLSGTPVPSPLTGLVVKINVKPSDRLKEGDVILVLEAMKMENEIVAPKDLEVLEVLVTSGQNIRNGTPLITYK